MASMRPVAPRPAGRPSSFGGPESDAARGWNNRHCSGLRIGCWKLHRKFGKLPFEKLFERAIQYGTRRVLVSPPSPASGRSRCRS